MRPKACAGTASSKIGDLLWKTFLKRVVVGLILFPVVMPCYNLRTIITNKFPKKNLE